MHGVRCRVVGCGLMLLLVAGRGEAQQREERLRPATAPPEGLRSPGVPQALGRLQAPSRDCPVLGPADGSGGCTPADWLRARPLPPIGLTRTMQMGTMWFATGGGGPIGAAPGESALRWQQVEQASRARIEAEVARPRERRP